MLPVVYLRLRTLEAIFAQYAAMRSQTKVPMVEPEDISKFDESQATHISQAEVEDVHANLVQMYQADAQTINASQVKMEQSAAANIRADRVSTQMSALANVDAGEVLLEQSAVGYLKAEKASVSGYNGVVAAGTADVRNSLAGFVVANDLHLTESRTILLMSQNIQGNVTTLMDTRSALIAGLLGGLFGGMMLLLGRMLFGRR